MKWTCTIILFASITSLSFAAEHTRDSLTTIKKNIESNKAVLVDVREQDEWNAGHVKGAIFLPLSSLQDGISKEEQKKLPQDKVVYLHCAVGFRAKIAASLLKKYNDKVQPLPQGYEELIESGFQKAK
ncbi:MAG: rhodanese-like domain-containing protein [Planctomycetes bacterium]|nr:rhodanese-like domain-containing protein [Planctomycetota bacterium]MCH9725706.1 rhodanese-like domain-containing protein [Planctomycetota bacterium]MCH9777761.1 rhodanese-like domain-containing protein [Planctomycetota bacterium]MCH9791213.1 rhodanese-like domain-containing protein [Planctomycetota bacterium]